MTIFSIIVAVLGLIWAVCVMTYLIRSAESLRCIQRRLEVLDRSGHERASVNHLPIAHSHTINPHLEKV